MALNNSMKWCVERVDDIYFDYTSPYSGNIVRQQVANYKFFPSINYYGVNYDLDAGCWKVKNDWIETKESKDYGIWKSTEQQYDEDGNIYSDNVWFAYDGFEVMVPKIEDVEKEGYELKGWGTVTGSAIEVAPGSNYSIEDSNAEFRTEWQQENISLKALWEPKNIGVQNANSITLNGATLTADYAAYYGLTDKGFMYKKATDSEWIDVKAIEQDGKLTATITGLDSNTLYDVKGYLENKTGRIENNVTSFRTKRVQSVGEVTVNNITSNGADFKASYISDDILLEKGFKYKKSSDKEWNTISATVSGDEISANISGLTDNTLYQVKAFIKTAVGETEVNVITYTTLKSNSGDSNSGSTTGGGSSPDTTQSHTNTPVIIDVSNKAGWEAISEQIKKTKEQSTGEEEKTITIGMNGSSVVPQDILESIRGTDITLVFNMSDGITWSVNGQSITEHGIKDIDLGVKIDTDAIQAELVNGVAGKQAYRTISLAHDGKFGFNALLSINMGKKNAGLYTNLYYYNPATKKLELQSVGRVNENGYVELDFTHASDYVAVLSTEDMLEKALDQIEISTTKGKLYVGGTRNRSMTLKLELPEQLNEIAKNSETKVTITYQSNNPKVATVTDTGKIVAKKSGKATIATRITIDGIQKSFTTAIQVSNAYIELTKSRSSLDQGDSFTFQAKGYGVNTEDIRYYTSSKSIIVINKKTGKATAKSAGADYVIARAGKVEVKIKVVVK
jgi:hypothetical protein